MSEAKEKAWLEWVNKRTQSFASKEAFDAGWDARRLEVFNKIYGGGYKGSCEACNIETLIGTREVPHPVNARLHTCVSEQEGRELDAMVNRETHQKVLILLEAIGKTAMATGGYNGEVPIDGPMALLLLSDLAFNFGEVQDGPEEVQDSG